MVRQAILTKEIEPEVVADRADGLDAEVESAVRLHSRLVYRIAISVLRSRSDAEDATQDVFLRVHRFREKFAGARNTKTYLAQIAWRVALSAKRIGSSSPTSPRPRSTK
ncbi:MAG: RNA polymerase sigma factor [Thermoanaerobaculia bacterium]